MLQQRSTCTQEEINALQQSFLLQDSGAAALTIDNQDYYLVYEPAGFQDWVLLGIVWGLAAIAITLTAIDLKKFRVFSMICYIGMGWTIIFKVGLLIQAVGWVGFWLILIGGVCYTVGAVLYGIGSRRKWMHSVFHVFVVLGSVLQFLAVIFYAL